MRISFVTSSLRLGHDGVGDYTCRLAAACVHAGHAVQLLSLAEPVAPEAATDTVAVDDVHLPVLRMTLNRWKAGGHREAKTWLREFSPDWTSLQFVPYGFHPQGWFGGCVGALAELMHVAPRQHIFSHETWIGFQRDASWKERWIGWRQKAATRKLLANVGPHAVQTNTECYRAMLAELGQRSEVVPVFGNVPIDPMSGGDLGLTLPDDALVGVMFGSLSPDWQPELFLEDFSRWAGSLQRPAVLVAAGSMRGAEQHYASLAERWQGRVSLLRMGWGPALVLSRLFQRCDFGVTSMPWSLLGKSSSTAALREHGLRVVVTRDCRLKKAVSADASERFGCVPYFRDRSLLPTAVQKTPPGDGLMAVRDRFISALSADGR